MMISILRLVSITLALVSSVSADAGENLEGHATVTGSTQRKLDTTFIKPTNVPTTKPHPPTKLPTKKPSPQPSPAPKPTKPPTTKPHPPTKLPSKKPFPQPTNLPTKTPTKAPTKKPTFPPTNKPTGTGPTSVPPPKCGTLLTKDGYDLTLGPYADPSDERQPSTFGCNTGESNWFAHSYYAPSYMYGFQLTQRCEYQFRTPEGNHEWQNVRDVNSWFEQAAKTLQHVDNLGYKASDDDIIFSGLEIPNYQSDLITNGIAECPEKYCIKVVGSSITRKSLGSLYNPGGNEAATNDDDLSLLYAFSSIEAWWDFYMMMYHSMKSANVDHIFLTNHFTRCGCESFCKDEDKPYDDVRVQATCYVEELCGQRVFQIEYADDYPDYQKISWASTGTTKVMDWFNECAFAMYGCIEHENSDRSAFSGSGYDAWHSGYPKKFIESHWEGQNHVYGLGGDKYDGFRSDMPDDEPQVAWSCGTYEPLQELIAFGEFVEAAEFMRDDGSTSSVPNHNPCEPEIFNPPESPESPPSVGPGCENVDHDGYCYQMPGATCFIAKGAETCAEVDFVMMDGTSKVVYGDVMEWTDACLATGTNCKRDERFDEISGELLYNGSPFPMPIYLDIETYEWNFYLMNMNNNGKQTVDGILYYNCDTWEDSYGAKNFTDGAGDNFHHFDNSYGDLFAIKPEQDCTPSPTTFPSETPSLSLEPSNSPSVAPTLCSESYLTSENLNIALVVDLSFSTYEKQFSSSVDIGDVNGDGKGNTILDAQVVAIQNLLTSISESESLDNDNCEIELISFETDAKAHGKWKPLADSGDGFNPDLMEYIKAKLRAPTSNDEVFNTNNGFTNFDAALDEAVEYFKNGASPNRKNLLVFLSDGEPNVRGDGDSEGYCSDTTVFWNGDDTVLQCSQLGLEPGERHMICRGDDPLCVEYEPLQDCVRGPTECTNADAVTQYDSEIGTLTDLNVERLAIGVGDESNVAHGSALWMIDNNPAKDLGVLPLQALNLEELTVYLSSLCILNTDPPTDSPSASPSDSPTKSPAPSSYPTGVETASPTSIPTDLPYFVMATPVPTNGPTSEPTGSPTQDPTKSPTTSPTTPKATSSPTTSPTSSPTAAPTGLPSVSQSGSPSGSFFPSSDPTNSPTNSPAPSSGPTGSPTASPTGSPTTSPSTSPTNSPTASPTEVPTVTPTSSPTLEPSVSPAPTFLLPDCYEGPKMVVKDSSEVSMCYYNQDMVQINEMKTDEVTLAINNVWTRDAIPAQLRVFVHTNGIDAILDKQDGDGFQCLNTDGADIDVEGHNEFTVQCHQVSEDAPWLAVIDVVITDEAICASNDAPHPCFPDGDPILESCSWRIVVPCGDEALCSEEPTSSPTGTATTAEPAPSTPSFQFETGEPDCPPEVEPTSSPTAGPTVGPTTGEPAPSTPSFQFETGEPDCPPEVDPTSSPTAGPTVGPIASPPTSPTIISTGDPTPEFNKFGDDDDDDTVYFPPIGPEECPDDVLLVKQEGITAYPKDAVRIVSQDTTTVTIELTQTYTDSTSTIDSVYYQFKENVFSNICLEEKELLGEDSVEITIECTHNSQIALLEFWVADDITKGVLSEGDNAIIPECCHPTVPEGTPTTKYIVEVKCVSQCPQVVQ